MREREGVVVVWGGMMIIMMSDEIKKNVFTFLKQKNLDEVVTSDLGRKN